MLMRMFKLTRAAALRQTSKLVWPYLNFKNFHPQTNKKVGKYNSLLTHFICRVIMILSIPGSGTMGTGMGTMNMGMGMGTSPACQESPVRVRDQVCVYRYKLPYPDKYHECGMGKGTTSLLS